MKKVVKKAKKSQKAQKRAKKQKKELKCQKEPKSQNLYIFGLMPKQKGGIIDFSTKCPTYYRWVVTRHNRASYVEATHAMAEISDQNSDSHQEMSPVR